MRKNIYNNSFIGIFLYWGNQKFHSEFVFFWSRSFHVARKFLCFLAQIGFCCCGKWNVFIQLNWIWSLSFELATKKRLCENVKIKNVEELHDIIMGLVLSILTQNHLGNRSGIQNVNLNSRMKCTIRHNLCSMHGFIRVIFVNNYYSICMLISQKIHWESLGSLELRAY